MAKLGLRNNNEKRQRLVKKYSAKRTALKAKMTPTATAEERKEAMIGLAKLPRNSAPTRVHNRCNLTGRARGYMRQFGVCRQQARTLAHKGILPGVRKSSWS